MNFVYEYLIRIIVKTMEDSFLFMSNMSHFLSMKIVIPALGGNCWVFHKLDLC
jgi:hypothetical protein